MNKLTIIGNLTREPELRVTSAGINVCDFSVAVNRRKTGNNQQPEADFFRVTVWRGLGETCAKYLRKGAKVCVVGAVSVRTYQTNAGETRASLEVTAEDVEFLSGKQTDERPEETADPAPAPVDAQSGFEQVETDELPF